MNDKETATSRGLRLGAFLLALGCAAGAAGQQPTLLTITPDGQFEDWAAVRANPDNLTLDWDGSTVPCPESADRDCVVPSNSGDLDFLAWTYDADSLYLLVRRFANSSGSDSIFLHVDRDRDGFVDTGEPVARFRFTGSTRKVGLTVFGYTPFGATRDPIVDALGYADGYTLPGSLGATTWSEPDETTGDPSGETFEVEVPWASLGLTGPTPFFFHLGVDNSCCAPNATDDNMGGAGGRVGDTGFLRHDVYPPRTGTAAPNEYIEHAHTVTNVGNLPDAYSLRAFSSEGYRVEILQDVDGDTFPDVLLGVDRRGDGDFIDSQDELYQDVDGDTLPETDVLQPGESWHLVVRVIATTGAKSYFETTRLETASLGGGSVQSVEDIVAVGWVTLQPPLSLTAEPGTIVRLCHSVTNHLQTNNLLDFDWASSRGWNYSVYTDPNGDCDPSDGFPLQADSNGDGRPDLNVVAGETVSLVAVANISAAEPVGSVERFTLNADSDINNSMQASVGDTVTVSELLDLSPTYRISDGSAKSGAPGTRLYFRHVLTFSGEAPDSFLLTAAAPPPNSVLLYSDPNGDGLPTDGTLLGASVSTGLLDARGGRFPFLVAVDVDPGAAAGGQFQVNVGAVSESNASLQRSVSDEVTVTKVAAFADPLFVLQESRYPLCSLLYGRATGLVPAQTGRYRIRWVFDQGPVTLQTRPFTSDADGSGYDTLSLTADSPPGSYTLLLEEWNGLSWGVLDQDAFLVDDFGVLDALGTDRPRYFVEGEDLGVTAAFLNDGDVKMRNQVIRFAVLTPDGSRILQTDGTFTPVQPDLWTYTTQPFTLDPGDSWSEGFTIPAVFYPGPGTYRLQAAGEGTCGSQLALVETTFEVVEDSDGDGWRDDFEIALGTDPYDRDTDDDGILDPLDGGADSDGDTVVDALDCDSDADGLPDGLEAGLVEGDLDPDTDLAAGCFVPDGDAGATLTDPKKSDTDGGGLSDGGEDLDGDGALDAGEKDPNDPTDDPCAWTAPPEVPSLVVTRSGDGVDLAWSDLAAADPCVTYTVLEAVGWPPADYSQYAVISSGSPGTSMHRAGVAQDGSVRFYLVSATGRIGGDGAVGHYGR